MLYVFNDNGECLERSNSEPVPSVADFEINHRGPLRLVRQEVDPHPGVPREFLRLAEGEIVVDPAWTPPAPPPDPLAELKRIVDQNILASEHDRRWLAQKEAAKRLGIAWIKAHPACTQAQAEAALTAALTAELPGEPLVASPAGVIVSYAKAAQARGHIPSATFEALRDLVAAASQEQLAQLLAKL